MDDGFTILEHPADIGIEAWGATLGEAFENAARGLTALILDPSSVEPRETRQLELDGVDAEHLLIRWLSEILYLYDGERFVVSQFVVHSLSPSHLRAVLRGEPFLPEKHPTRTDVKAVTYHQLQVDEGKESSRVRVFLDI
jgi:SHS2 domain-containing protein